MDESKPTWTTVSDQERGLLTDADGKVLADFSGMGGREAIAEAVRRWNAYPDLVAALEWYGADGDEEFFIVDSKGERVASFASMSSRAKAALQGLSLAPASSISLKSLLQEVADEFGGSIEQYYKIGPDYTHKDGTEVFEVSILLDRADLIDRIRAALSNANTEG